MLQVKSKVLEAKDYSYVGFSLPENINASIVKWGKENIKDENVFPNPHTHGSGREDELHCTVKFGLHTSNLKEIKEAIFGTEPFTIELSTVSRFTSEDYDVIKIGVISKKLHDLHEKLSALENSDQHPEYRPHITIAYVKKGRHSDLVGERKFSGKIFEVSELQFTPVKGEKATIIL